MPAKSVSPKELAHLSELIDAIYQGATDPSRWNATLPAIADWVKAPRALLFTPQHHPDKDGFSFNHAIPEQFTQRWAAKYHKVDVWAKRATERGLLKEGNIINGDDDLIPLEELRQTEVYQILSEFGMVHLLSTVVLGLDPAQNIPWGACALYRSEGEGRFAGYERDRLAMLSPHLSRSLGVMSRLRDLELKVASSLGALDRLSVAVLLFGARGQISFANRAALRILGEEDGLRLRHFVNNSSLGEIVADDSNSHSALTSAIFKTLSPDLHTEHYSHAVTVPRLSGRPKYTLNFSALAVQNEFGSGTHAPRAIAFITDNAEPIRLDGELLKKTYGLTPAELRLTEIMTECPTIEEAATRLSLSGHTVRSQLRSVYMKTSTNNRAMLMRLIMSLSQIASSERAPDG